MNTMDSLAIGLENPKVTFNTPLSETDKRIILLIVLKIMATDQDDHWLAVGKHLGRQPSL